MATAASRRPDHIEVKQSTDEENKRLVISQTSSKPYEFEIQTTIAACSAASCGHLKILQRFYQIGISMDAGDYDKDLRGLHIRWDHPEQYLDWLNQGHDPNDWENIPA